MIRFKINYLKKRRTRRRIFNRGAFGVRLFFVLVFLFSVLGMVLFSVQMSFVGARIASLDLEERSVLEQKLELEERIAREDSLVNLSQKAEEMGFLEMGGNTVYLGKEKLTAELH